jgi:hypothetical protein
MKSARTTFVFVQVCSMLALQLSAIISNISNLSVRY